jgi:glycosyltransferase involved in cell wall biosynthesis
VNGAGEPLRVALVHPFSWPEVRRGGERYLDDLGGYLAGRGHRVEVITGTDGPSTTEARRDGVVVRRLHHRLGRRLERMDVSKADAFGAVALPRLLIGRYDVVHALTPSPALAARATRNRTVFTILGHPTADQLGVRRFDERIFHAALRRSDEVVALSEASAAAAQEVFGKPVGVLPPGVRLERFPLEPEPRTGPPRVLFSAASDDPRKRLDLVLEAFAGLLQRRPDARLLLSGSGDPTWAIDRIASGREAVAAAVDRLGAGGLDDVPSRYRAATVTVLPSRYEAFGLALVESLSSGTPVVCTQDGGMPEIVDDRRVGRVVPRDDPAALATALDEAIDLAADPATPARCAAHAQRWGWQEIGPRHEEVYRSVLAGQRAGASRA